MSTLNLYLAMFYRGNLNGGDIFHWGLLGLMDSASSGTFCNANQYPGWAYEVKSCDPGKSPGLVALFKVGAWQATDTEDLQVLLGHVPIGESVNEPDLPWACNVWTADALRLLHSQGEFLCELLLPESLPSSSPSIGRITCVNARVTISEARDFGAEHRDAVASGDKAVQVGISTTSF